MILDFVFKQVVKLSSIGRWAIIETLKPQSVAEHSYNVAMITMAVYDRMEVEYPGVYSKEDRDIALRWALCHDLTEIVTGDFPSSLKSHFGHDISQMEKEKFPLHAKLKEKIHVEHETAFRIVKAADFIDAIHFAHRFCIDEGKSKIIGDMRYKLSRILMGGADSNKNDMLLELINAIWPDIWNA